MQSLLSSILQMVKLDEVDLEKLSPYVKEKTVQKNVVLLKQGAIARYIYFIESGLLYSTVFQKDKDIVSWFAQENEFFTSMYSFISQKPSFETIIALEESKLYYISYDDLQKLYLSVPKFERLGRILTEHYFIQLEERTLSLQYQSAKERYNDFMKNYPELHQRVSLGLLASFLGISQETLSRVRGK